MEEDERSCSLGIDLGDEHAYVSVYQLHMDEPETISAVAGSGIYQIPVLLAKRRNLGMWYYGDDARKMAKSGEVICVDHLLSRAMKGEVIGIDGDNYDACDLLALYLRKLMELSQKLGSYGKVRRLVITAERITRESMEVFWRVAARLGLTEDQFLVLDHKESFYYYALSQDPALWVHDVFLLEYWKDTLRYYDLKRDVRTKPQMVTIYESKHLNMAAENRDEELFAILNEVFDGRIISTVYLVGDGFEGDWMKRSLNVICRGRRAFIGKNLFSKGACYGALIREQEENWNFVYMGENEIKFNLSIRVRDKGEIAFYNLISAGRNWYETTGECEVILSDVTEIDFWKQLPNSREAKIETLELTDLPRRPNRTTRVRIIAKPVADDRIEIEIRDLGFGDFFRATDKIWKYTMQM